jgi:hypothetical protein
VGQTQLGLHTTAVFIVCSAASLVTVVTPGAHPK